MLQKEITLARPQYEWPDNYYMETDPTRRRAYLDQALSQSPSLENEMRLLLWKKRYTDAKGQLDGTDHFLKMWTDMPHAVKQKDALFGKRFTKNYIKEWMDTYAFEEMDKHPECQDIWYREFLHFASFYIEISRTDSTYSTAIFGIGKLPPEALAAKFAEDFQEKTKTHPTLLGLYERQKLLEDAVWEAYRFYFPGK